MRRRDAARYARIRRFVLRTFVHAVFWDVLLAARPLARLRRPALPRWRDVARRYRLLAAEMGGVLIKIGQFLSTRVDLLPAEIIDELSGLQDEVPPAPFSAVEREIAAAFPGGSPFADVSPTVLGAASLAQVHPARLADGREVVVKVLRPDIDLLVATDLAAVRLAVRLLAVSRKIRRRVDLDRLAEEIATTTLAELDLVAEAANAERFAAQFAGDPGLGVPRVYREASSRRVLAVERVAGIKVNDRAALAAAGVDPGAVARRLYGATMRQIFEHWFVHADPHPGNLFVQPLGDAVATPAADGRDAVQGDGRPFRIVYIDFGMMASVPPHLRESLREVAIALGTRDAVRLIQAYAAAGVVLPDADLERLEEVHTELFARFWGVAVGKMRDAAFSEARYFLRKYRDVLYEMPFQVPVDLLFVARAVGLLAGLATALDPDFDPWAETIPFAERLARAELARGLPERARAAIAALAALPRRLDSTLARAERGALVLRTEPGREARRQNARLERALGRLACALLAGSFAVAAALLIGADGRPISPWFFVAAAIALVFLLRFALGRNL